MKQDSMGMSEEKNTERCFFVNETRAFFPEIDIEVLKNAILGAKYTLSVACVSKKKIEKLNKEYRDKDYIPNILSFPYDEKKGDIFLQPSIIRKQIKEFGMTYENLAGFMLIHGMLHLKGYDHGTEMDVLEEKWSKKFGFINK